MNAMLALLKFLVLIALFLLASNANAFISLSSVAGTQVRINHVFRFEEPMSKPSNEPNDKPTKQMDLDAELPNNLSSKRVKSSLSQKQDAELQSKITDTQNTQTCGLCHNKKSEPESLAEQPFAATDSSQNTLPKALDPSASSILSAALDPSANTLLSATLDSLACTQQVPPTCQQLLTCTQQVVSIQTRCAVPPNWWQMSTTVPSIAKLHQNSS